MGGEAPGSDPRTAGEPSRQRPASGEPRLYGLVLAGGAGTRMGSEKAGLVIGGLPLAQHAAARLAAVAERVFVSVRPGQRGAWLQGLASIEDAAADLGPITGVLAAFAHEPNAAWLVVAVDMPFVTEPMLRQLAAARGAGFDAVAFRNDALGGPEPLCALYEPGAGAELAQRAAAGEHSLRRILASMRVRLLLSADPDALVSLNTPDELARARAKAAADAPGDR